MQNTSNYSDGRQFTAWAAIIAAIQAWACAGFYAAATGGDFGMVLRPAEFLALPTTAIDQFWLAMILDCLGFYLPFLIIGAYFWARLRPDHGVPMDMALLCIVVYVILGTAGAGIQFSTLHPLVVAHAAGDSMSQAASEKAWLAISPQRGPPSGRGLEAGRSRHGPVGRSGRESHPPLWHAFWSATDVRWPVLCNRLRDQRARPHCCIRTCSTHFHSFIAVMGPAHRHSPVT